ncbi:hemerythrin domain-containing protein [Kribbella capetownensis]|uniref:Hemerythrin domain-containing protein n=1 Tax=Kribbella capetownensis TaxID=1572659 RepID=A0A4R0JWV5_9ACTN|nr:hemerythrin domain-containing protein [Kribbella capetownensis]TCC46795.1 hemerythrin domain-containing protein [Kribbella capetownensis]
MSRLQGFGNQLVAFHDQLRDQIDVLREQDAPDGKDLLTHCLAFCGALTRHHTGEDEGAFMVLAEEYPDLRPVLEELARDHLIIAAALQRLENLAELDPAERKRELDTVAALMETHFTYEERKLVTALNGLEDDGTGRLALPFR